MLWSYRQSWSDHPNTILRGAQIIKFFGIYSSLFPFYFFPLSPKYLPQHSILEHPQPMLFPQSERPSFIPIQPNRWNYISVYFNLYIFGWQTGRQKILFQMIISIFWLEKLFSLFLYRWKFGLLRLFPKVWTLPHFEKCLLPTFFICYFACIIFTRYYSLFGARGSEVGWGTVLQIGRSRVWFPMVSMEFFIDIILPAAL